MSKKSKLIATVSLLLLVSTLAGCSIRRNLSKSEYTKFFSKTSKDLITSKNIEDTLYGKKKLTKKQKATLKKAVSEYANSTQKNLDTLKKYDTFTSYPSAVKKYGELALKYEKALLNNESQKQLKAKYHTAAKQSIEVNKQAGFENKTQTITKNVLIHDPAYTIKKESKTTKSKNSTSKKAKSSSKSKKSTKQEETPQSIIAFSPAKGIVLILVSVLLIVVVFIQPSKSDDSMGALSATGGDSMFAKPKPRGYELFLIRSTEVLIVVMLGIILSGHWLVW